MGARITKEETILDPKFDVSPHSYARPATLALQYIGHAVRHAIFPHKYARFCLFFSFFFLFFLLLRSSIWASRLCHACVTILVALQYARLVVTKLNAVVKSE